MKILDCFNIQKGKIAVLGAKEDSPFVKLLIGELKEKGSCAFISDLSEEGSADYNLYLADQKNEKLLAIHSDIPEDIAKIGVVDVNIFEKKVSDMVENIEDFCLVADTNENQLIYLGMLSKAIKQSEKYDFMFIDGVDSVDKKYLARELAKQHSMPVCNGMAKDGEIELLRKNI